MLHPVLGHSFPQLLVVQASISKKGGRNKDVANKSCDLALERLAATLPPRPLRSKTVKQTHTSVNLELHASHLGLDTLCLADQSGIFVLVRSNTVFKLDDSLLDCFCLRLGLKRLLLQLIHFF